MTIVGLSIKIYHWVMLIMIVQTFLTIKGNHQDNIEKLQSQITKLLYVPLNYHDYAKYICFFCNF
jgi:hypothetical protein